MLPRARALPALALVGVATLAVACGGGGTKTNAAVTPSAGSSANVQPVGSAGAGATPGSTAPTAPGAGTPGAPGTPGTPAAAPQLPQGGTQLFPDYRVIAYYGSGNGPGLGILGKGTPEQAAEAIEKQAKKYAPFGRKIQPAMELITTTAQSSPGPNGTYSSNGNPDTVQKYLDVARKHKMLLIMDFQPGRSRFLPQVQRFEKFIAQPDVGVALDAEWRMKPNQVPAKVVGSAQASEINEVSQYVADITAKNHLPEKMFLVHQFQTKMLPDRSKIVARPGLATVYHADGFGTQSLKKDVYKVLNLPGPPFRIGFKLFYKADTKIMSPAQAMALKPQPDLITYQ